MNGPYMCGCVEQFGDGSPALKLGTNRPLVYVQDALPGFSRDVIWSWLKEGHARWGAVCDWLADRIDDMSDAGPNDIVQLVTVADLGGGGVLADQMLPYSGGSVLRMRINSRIKWKATDGQMASGTVDPVRTLCHETGHFQGHTHWPQGQPLELMEPYVQQTITRPQSTEGKMSASWFGQPVTPPPLPPSGDYDFSKIILDYTVARSVKVRLAETMVELEAPEGGFPSGSLKITDANGKPAIMTWPGL